MGQRSDLHTLLKSMAPNVYFQPPSSIQLIYPCIMYKREDLDIVHADNMPYKQTKRYQVTVIDENPDSPINALVAQLPLCSYDRFYTAEKLNHDVYSLFF